MNLSEENKKREEFREILRYLSKSQNALEHKSARVQIYRKLEGLYSTPAKEHGFRHFYSDIFGVLAEIKNRTVPGDINILGQNLREIRKGYQSQNMGEDGKLIDISANITKLYDHVSLDVARMEYSDKGDWEVSGKKSVHEIKNKIKELEEATDNIQKENRKIQDSSRNMQKDYVAILGIFAAVLMVFFSGIGFSSSVLANIDKASIYRVSLGIMLLGIILFNVICFLLSFIREMVNKNSINKFLIISGNAVFMVLLGLIFLAWKYSWLGDAGF
ncbi:MAG: hypothetical protein SPI25_05205 [Dialister sp.]|nr:hypothetical protein [Dialister sp.]